MKRPLLRAYFYGCLVVLLVTALSSFMGAQTAFVSTGAGQQLLAFDSNSGAVTGVCNISPAVPEDVVVGPDGNLYVADTTGNKIWRVPIPIAAPASTPASCNATEVYDITTASCTNSVGNTVKCPTGPEGPSFLRINTLDLYFNTHGANASGVWKIPGVANKTAPPPPPGCTVGAASCPVQVSSSNASGEGLDFDIFGQLLAVDQTDGQVLRDPVACLNNTSTNGCFSSLITGLSAPVGVAVNTCGDVLVASGNAVNRYVEIGTPTPTAPLQTADSLRFKGNNIPRFLEVDSTGRLFLITAGDEAGKGATFWRFDPPANSSFTSCALTSFTPVLSVPIETTLAAGIATSNGLGLGISATNASIKKSFTAVNPSNIYNFGSHSVTVTCNAVNSAFDLTITAAKSIPTDAPGPEVTFSSPFPSVQTNTPPQCPVTLVNPECMHYGGQHGFCTQYIEQATDPNNGNAIIPDANLPGFCSASPNPFTFLVNFDSAEFVNDPGGAHVSSQNVADAFTECQSEDFYPQLSTGDPVRLTGGNSKHVVFNAGPMFNGAISLNSPISSCATTNGITTCNPQFNIGQNINVKFTLLQNVSPFAAITTATEQLSIARTSHTAKAGKLIPEFVPQTVVATKNSATLNFFVPNSSGQYSYNVDSSAFDQLPKETTATYQFTIWGNGAPPFSFFTTGTF